ncbi:MAG: NADH-quinone oxidoreductase subunit N [Planctomycetia bacterium]|nr:NADH-quinone oxidoreductase subunit N [Planctomycetia bacterium]
MNFSDIINTLSADTRASLPLFGPELILIGTIVALLLVRLFNADKYLPGSIVAIIGTALALARAAAQFWMMQNQTSGSAPGIQDVSAVGPFPMFTGLLLYDPFTVYFRIFLLLFLLFVEWLTVVTGIPDLEDAPDFYVLLLGSTLGMMLMASANHLLMVFLAVEMTSVPSYAMVGFLKGRKSSSEAALKYVVYGAGAAGVMLYGISLLSGLLGTAHLPSLAQALVEFGRTHTSLADDAAVRTLAFAILTILVGVAFKLSLFPFHFWCPDAFEGAAAEVGAFLSVASKGAAFALLVRFCLALVGESRTGGAPLSELYMNIGVALGFVAAVTATFGNLAAYTQTNMKRLLAYSTIAHAGYMLMAVAAMMVILNAPGGGSLPPSVRIDRAATCIQGLLYYLAVYFFMNLGAFAIVALIRNQTFSEEIADYAGLSRQSPLLAACMLICLFSLVGLPPFGGFAGKFMVFASVWDAGKLNPLMWIVLAAGLINTVFSLFYYIKVLRFMYITPPADEARPVNVPLMSDAGLHVAFVTLPVLALGIFVNWLSELAQNVARWLL